MNGGECAFGPEAVVFTEAGEVLAVGDTQSFGASLPWLSLSVKGEGFGRSDNLAVSLAT